MAVTIGLIHRQGRQIWLGVDVPRIELGFGQSSFYETSLSTSLSRPYSVICLGPSKEFPW